MQKTLLGANPDGSPRYSYVAEEGEHLILTGKIVALLTVEDGTEYDVSDPVVATSDIDHHDELVMAIGDYYEEKGHPDHQGPDDPPFEHDREATRKMLAERRKALGLPAKKG